ncbi:uncharacterized protein [Nicotiana sylvestris]|uniref:uncharacterized protein n=1 Tax=Nicotiana sylvestris TaxID=4096 RepID=UPI00388CBB60
MLRKDAETSWIEDCQKAFDKIKEYRTTPLVLVPLEPWRPLLLYLSVLDGSFRCVLGQHDKTGRKEQVIYYLSKKFTPYEARFSLLERTCCALTQTTQKLRHYFYAYTTYLIYRMDPVKYIYQKPMPTGKLVKWQILLREYEPLKPYFPDEKLSFVGEDIAEAYDGWRMFFDGAANFKGVGIGVVLVSETGQHYPISTKLRFPCTNNMTEYEACIMGLNLAINMNIQELLVHPEMPPMPYADMIKVPPNELNATSAPWPFVAWGMDGIGPIEPTASTEHRFILVAINYFNKWVEAASYKVITNKVVQDFVKDCIVYQFGVPESIITDNATNLNSDLMKSMCESFKSKATRQRHEPTSPTKLSNFLWIQAQ